MFNKLASQMFFFLWAASLYALIVLFKTYHKELKNIWGWSAVNLVNLKPLLFRWVVASLGMILFVYIYDSDKAFGLIEHRPDIIPYLLVLYPVLSALPQELIFCSFFFLRYGAFFGDGQKMVIASSVAFAYAHLLYINPVAPTLSLVGGLIFASTYLKTKSLALVTLEHGLYGNTLFLSGLGYYFYGGNVS